MNMPISQSQMGTQLWGAPLGESIPTNEEGQSSSHGSSNYSFFEALATAFRLAGEGVYEQQTDQMQQSLKSFTASLQAKRQAAFASADAEKSAAKWRFGADMLCGAMSLGSSLITVAYAGVGGKALKDMHVAESPLENKLNLAKVDLKQLDANCEATPQAFETARNAVSEARFELSDLRSSSNIADFKQAIERSTTVSNISRSVNDGLGGWGRAVGNIAAADDDVDKKKLDVNAQMDEANAQYAMQLVQNRRADTTKTADQADRMQTALAQVNQNAARGLAGA